MTARAYTEDQLVEQPAVGLFAAVFEHLTRATRSGMRGCMPRWPEGTKVTGTDLSRASGSLVCQRQRGEPSPIDMARNS